MINRSKTWRRWYFTQIFNKMRATAWYRLGIEIQMGISLLWSRVINFSTWEIRGVLPQIYRENQNWRRWISSIWTNNLFFLRLPVNWSISASSLPSTHKTPTVTPSSWLLWITAALSHLPNPPLFPRSNFPSHKWRDYIFLFI
jgi:hypothetical protein